MKKSIFYKFIIVLSLALILSGSIFAVTISSVILDRTREDMLYILQVAEYSLDYSKDLKAQLDMLKTISDKKDTRFTIMDLEGNVLADSNVNDHTQMENHSNRKEVQEAIILGIGEARRYSDTLQVDMLYVTSLSKSGDSILRIAVPFSGMRDYMGILYPAIIISIGITLIVSSLLARQFSGSITKPLNEIAEEMLKRKDEKLEFNFKHYSYEEINVIAETTMKMMESVKDSMKRIEFERMIRQEFFSNASHELKTPITSVKGYIELLESGMFTDENMKQDFLSRIKKETENMTNLINDILMISRLETKEVEVTLTEVRLCPLLTEVFSSFEPLAAEFKVHLEMNCRPLIMYANTQQLTQLFSNLISNAIKYNRPGGKVLVTVTSELEDIIIIVEDNGVGIAQEAIPRVFERFFRVDKGRSKKMGGTGLGLSIVKHVVNYYNGTIKLESKLQVGTKFIVRLPKNKNQKPSY